MDERIATKLVEKTFGEEFNEDRYLEFVIEVFGDSSFLKSPKKYSMWANYREYADSLKYYGTYRDSSNKTVDILSVGLKKNKYVNKLRTVQRNIIVKWLTDTNRDSALVAFYGDGSEDWRFSFVKMEYEITEDFKIKKEFTPVKRCSYLVGKNGANYICKKNFLKLVVNEKNPTLEEIENAFNVEIISDEFLERYKNLFSGNIHTLKIEESQIMELKNIMLDYRRMPLDSHQKQILDKIIKTIGRNIKRFFIKYKHRCDYIPISKFKSRMLLSDEELILCILRNMKYIERNIIHLNKTESEIEKERIEESTFNRLLFKYRNLYDPESESFSRSWSRSIRDLIKASNTNELKNMLINYENMPLNTHQKQILDRVLRAIGRRISYLPTYIKVNNMRYMNICAYKADMKMNNKEFALFVLKNGRYAKGKLQINTEEDTSMKLRTDGEDKSITNLNDAKKHDNTVKQNKIIVEVLGRTENLLTIKINNKIVVKKVVSYNITDNKITIDIMVVKKVVSYNITDNKITIDINHNKKKYLKITIMCIKKGKKSKRYYIYGAEKEELENTIITEIGTKKRIIFKGK